MKRQDEFLRDILYRAKAAQQSVAPGLFLANLIDEIEERLPQLQAVAYENHDLSSGLSWDGKIICGDRKSVDAVKTALHNAETIETFWRPNHITMQRQLINVRKALK